MDAAADAEFSAHLTRDPPWRMQVDRGALRLLAAARGDSVLLARRAETHRIAGQLRRAVGSVASNIAEGRSRATPGQRARFRDYALGSLRKALVWYELSRDVLGGDDVATRLVGNRRPVPLVFFPPPIRITSC